MMELTILCQSAGLVTQEILDPAKVFGYCTRPDYGSLDTLIVFDEPCIDRFTHVEIDTKTNGHDCGEEDQEAHHVDVPGPALDLSETSQCYKYEGQRECEDAQPLGESVDLKLQQASL